MKRLFTTALVAALSVLVLLGAGTAWADETDPGSPYCVTTLAERQYLTYISTQDDSGKMMYLAYYAWKGMPAAEKAACSAVKVGHEIVSARNAGASEYQISTAIQSGGFTASEAQVLMDAAGEFFGRQPTGPSQTTGPRPVLGVAPGLPPKDVAASADVLFGDISTLNAEKG